MSSVCIECGGPLGTAPKLLLFAVGMSGYETAHPHCADCHKVAHERGGPGPNARDRGMDSLAVAIQRRNTAPLVPGTRG